MKKTHLIMIDPQNDFCDQPEVTLPNGVVQKPALPVTGATKDMERLAAFITKNGSRFSQIHCTLDSHHALHIANPIFWVDSKGNHPSPFTLIGDDDVRQGKWRTTRPDMQAWGQQYVDSLKKGGRYALCIWPPHCLIGTWGSSVYPAVAQALVEWENKYFRQPIDFVPKGSNIQTEHYSALKADVETSDITTKLNTGLVDLLQEADEILITGEALSHCVNFSIRDVCGAFGPENTKKFVLLRDTTSSVPGFEKNGDDFVKWLLSQGAKVSTTSDWV